MTGTVSVLDDLAAEQQRLEDFLTGLDGEQWQQLSATPPWTITDVMLHLAQTEEAVVATLSGSARDEFEWGRDGETLDEAMARLVADDAAPAREVFARWKSSRHSALDALHAADPNRKFPWVTTALRPNTLATTRLAEHWAHGLDVTEPFGADYPDTDRIRHIAWLAHATLPYAFAMNGHESADVYCELSAPSGDVWRFGNDDASSRIAGTASAFCRVAAQRLDAAQSGLNADGPVGELALNVVRTYAA